MCGLVFMGSKIITYRELEVFEDLLFCDTLRGNHSTGVCSIYKDKDTGTKNKMLKAAMSGPAFISAGYLDEVLAIRNKNGAITTVERPIAAFGHNRYATKGEVNSKNAHPFIHEHITLAHNGTLSGQHRLVDYKNFEVDSENIAYSISKVGFEETLKNLDGAFTLIWHDSVLNTVNIIRNKERPFYLVRTVSNDWFGASEKEMLLWILGRQKTTIAIAEQFECEPGVQYVFDVTNGVFSFKEKVKHELPTFSRFQYTSSTSYGNYGYDYDTWPHNRNRTESTTAPWKKEEEKKNEALKEAGLRVKIGDYVTFKAWGMEENTTAESLYCSYEGYLYPDDVLKDYVAVKAHGQLKTNYKENGLYMGKIVRVETNEQFGMVSLIVGTVSETTVTIDASLKVTNLPVVINSPTIGEEITYNKILSDRNIDLECGESIYFEAKGYRQPVGKDNVCVIYGNCIEEGFTDLIVDSVPVSMDEYCKGGIYSGSIRSVMLENSSVILTVEDIDYYAEDAKIVEPRTDSDDDNDSVIEYDISKEISNFLKDDDLPFDDEDISFEISRNKDVSTLKTGEVFTRGTWELSHHSICSDCGKFIRFEDSSQASIWGGSSFCKDCMDTSSQKKKELTISESTNEVLNKHNLRFRHGQSLDFTATSFMSYGNHNTKGSIFGETDTKIRIAAPDNAMGDFHNKAVYTGIITSARESADILTIFVTKIAVKSTAFFYCEDCNKRKPTIQRDVSNKDEYVCIECSQKKAKRKILTLVKTEKDAPKKLVNGHIVTKFVWESKMCHCKQCNYNIPWTEATTVSIIGGIPLCKTCESKVA